MLRNLFGKKSSPAQLAPAIPAGERVYAIGDIHGCNIQLIDLLNQIDADDAAKNSGRGATRTTVIFLGDLMDRGPDSAGVINTAMAYQDRARGTHKTGRFLMGNHEDMFLESVSGDARALRYFLKYGGRETVLSYGLSAEEYDALDFDQLALRLLEIVPRNHADFVREFEDSIVVGDYAFVHAGIRPGVPMEQQKPKDLRWIREDFLQSTASHEKVIVFGHTIFKDVEMPGNRIGIDTGAYNTGVLTAIGLEGTEQWFLQTQGHVG
jgi:serine/threonine protein phosphatase 1